MANVTDLNTNEDMRLGLLGFLREHLREHLPDDLASWDLVGEAE